MLDVFCGRGRRSSWRIGLMLGMLAVSVGLGCGPGGVKELWSEPDANEILQRHFDHIRKQSVVTATERIRIEGSMRMDTYLGNFTLTQNEAGHYALQFSGKADAATGPGVRNRAMPPSMVLSAGWNGSVEWGKVNGMLVKQESLLERRENGLGILDYTEKTMASSSNLKFIGRMKVRDQEAFIVEHRPESGVVAKMYFDVESYELLSADSSGPGRAAQMEFFDWKVVDGSYGPTRVTGKWNGKDLGMVITGIAYDPTIDAAIFSP